ncbi:leucine-rich repeat domain-containing protein [Segatella intestinalis]|uniref:leucine-rich repeat domain-containing protein n=1 Tax=Segatella intestinalis TaxID=3035284 RepID=UPI0023EBD1AD|nr:leucine-rich repeat domain-containing protein [Prevotella sp. B2-R-102]MDF4241731.1 leucine-rich repeat domain-containing protein [Prevotella sp. B2-R-102]
MKKKLLLSMILLALCLIQASADTYYFKIQLSNADGTPGAWSNYIKVDAVADGTDDNGKTKYKYPNGLRTLLNGGTVTVEDNENQEKTYTLPKNGNNEVNLDRIYGIAFVNGKGKGNSTQQNIMEGDEYEAWKEIRGRIKYLRLRDYIRDSYNDNSYFMYMDNVEELELPKDGMNVGSEDNDGIMYFANAGNLKKITICDKKGIAVDITDDAVTDKPLLNRVGKFMFSNCCSLSTKYINRLIKNVTEIKDNAFYANDEHRGYFSDKVAGHNMAIEIPSSVTKIGSQAFYNRVKVTGLIIHGNGGSLEIGSQAFRRCEQLHTLNLDNAKITYLGTGVFGDCRSMTNEFVNGVLTNYAANGGKKIPAYLFFGCNGQDGHDGLDPDKNKNVCSFTDLNIPAQFTEIGDGAFASTGDAKIKLKTITVNSEKAPTCLQGETDEYANIKNKSVFAGLDPNMTTVIFADKAQNWEETETTGFLTYMNDGSEFQRLLTKDLYSDHTEYKNVPQQHAIVKLHRTLKEGWNTICLPFGVNNRYGSLWGEAYKTKQAHNARIIVNGLTNNDSKANGNNFKMGVYRGYWRDGKTFMFLHYTDFDAYPLDLGETFLVKMRKQDIAEDGIYTFRNVDLNYRWSADGESGNDGNWTLVKTYSAEEMLGQVKDFNGEVNTAEKPFAGKATYVDYVLRGSLVQCTGTVGDSKVGITTDDYFFQQSQNGTMKLYPYPAGKTYGIRGFSGWFHRNNSNSNAHELSLSLFDDSCTTPIETVKVDDLNRDTSGKVYSISGVLMKNNAADLNNLPKGIYVVNGKKYVVK